MKDTAPAITPGHQAFWKAARAGRLEVQRCNACRRFRFFPAPVCPHCLSTDTTWEPVSGKATLYSYTTVQRAPNAALAKETPYTIALVELAEGVRIMSRLEGMSTAGARVGAPVIFAGVGESDAGPWLRFRCQV